MDAKEMIAASDHHMRRELAADVEGLMATMAPNPVWGHPEGPKIEGREAIRAHYEAILKPGRYEARCLRSWQDIDRQEAVNEYVVGVHLEDGSGDYIEYPVVQIVTFENGLMQNEELYFDPERLPVDHTGKTAH